MSRKPGIFSYSLYFKCLYNEVNCLCIVAQLVVHDQVECAKKCELYVNCAMKSVSMEKWFKALIKALKHGVNQGSIKELIKALKTLSRQY